METPRDPKIPRRRTIQLSDEDWRKVRLTAVESGTTVSRVIAQLIHYSLTRPQS